MKRIITIVSLVFALLISACGNTADETPASPSTVELSPTPAATLTPDPCSAENLPAEATKVHKLTREFDDYSTLASNTPQSQLVTVIPELQRVLRDAEDQPVPACLTDLKNLQLIHMNLVVQTLLAFVSQADVNVINQGIARSRESHTQYDIELARLLGLTVVVPTAPPVVETTPDPNATLPNLAPSPVVVNPGPSGVNLRSAPDLNAPEIGALQLEASTLAFGRTADNVWIQVEIPGQPGQTAWVYASLVQLSVPLDQLPIVTP